MKIFPGLRVIDITAVRNNWPDKFGTILEIDGSNIKVQYDSGAVRWKAWWNLQISDDNSPEMLKKVVDND